MYYTYYRLNIFDFFTVEDKLNPLNNTLLSYFILTRVLIQFLLGLVFKEIFS